ncbi:right-handed parallel beta-helix repeat-containing protein [Mucilaginibacter sp. BT774]|uniref:right-handed parallel beta-helix repeat-containing protein n=1 Tax=Mucilaginibacter sp. BT774 TaxID=3062276 RepID=UPI0026755190|nr:right-handed parallel beta-helix repeat-containing protein [Mucilaginibacter sp. BT774]MDO3629091.1 right-handed parallel beta-helix repeat-containing protein [Mucilaginibacter sp. BT774]
MILKRKQTTSWMGLMLGVTLLSTSIFTSCSKDSSVVPSSTNANTLDKSHNSSGVGPTKSPTGTTTGTTTGGTTTSGGTTTGATTGTGTTGTSTNFTYKASAPISLNGQNNITISGELIDVNHGGTIGIHLSNCNNVHITKCKIMNSTTDGIQLSNCTNVTIDSCFITNVRAGVNAMQCKTVKVNSNQFLNMNGPFPSGNFVQLNNVSGGGIQVNYNRCEDIAGVALHPQDGISIYQCDGLPGDSVQVIGNWIRGGQVQNDSGGGAGIVLGDVGGSYQVARNNIVVNGGFVGMQVQGGSHIKMDHNTIYSISTPYSNCGLCYGNYSGASSSNIYMGYNKIRFYQKSGAEMDAWWDPSTAFQPDGWTTNSLKASIDASLLPTTIITMN